MRSSEQLDGALDQVARQVHYLTCPSPIRCLGPSLAEKNAAQAMVEEVDKLLREEVTNFILDACDHPIEDPDLQAACERCQEVVDRITRDLA